MVGSVQLVVRVRKDENRSRNGPRYFTTFRGKDIRHGKDLYEGSVAVFPLFDAAYLGEFRCSGNRYVRHPFSLLAFELVRCSHVVILCRWSGEDKLRHVLA